VGYYQGKSGYASLQQQQRRFELELWKTPFAYLLQKCSDVCHSADTAYVLLLLLLLLIYLLTEIEFEVRIVFGYGDFSPKP
jgi:hypothetical protein